MFILIRLTQHVSGIIMPTVRRTDYVNNCVWSMPGCVGCSRAVGTRAVCTMWSRLLDCFVKLGVHGMGQRSAVKEGWSHKGSARKLVSLFCGRNVMR